MPFAEAVFDISYFRSNPLPFYTLAHELYPGKYRPTVSHSFVRLLSDKGLLLKLFSQNIDCLDREAGVPRDKTIEAHGSFATHRCIECKAPYPDDLMRQAVSKAEVPHCLEIPQCNGLVKPDIVFFGEALPETFHNNRSLPSNADLCIVMGTSLSVEPFASLPGFCSEGVPRVLINSERVGGLGSRPDDVLILGDCDAGVRKLAAAIGWTEELEALWNETNSEKQEYGQNRGHDPSLITKDENLTHQIASLTEEIDRSLRISSEHDAKIRGQLVKEAGQRIGSDDIAPPASVMEDQPSSRNLDTMTTIPAARSGSTSVEQPKDTIEDRSRADVPAAAATSPKIQLQSTSVNESKISSKSKENIPSSEALLDEGTKPSL